MSWATYPPNLGKCPWCSGANGYVIHNTGPCPRVKAIEYHPNGTIKRVEFRDAAPHFMPSVLPPANAASPTGD